MGAEEVITEVQDADSISELEQKIIRQIEYYFGNYNLGRDKFLREQVKLDDGWVPLELIVKFNRLKSLSEDFAVILAALKKSSAQLMEVNEDATKIRRRVEKPLPEENQSQRDEVDGRSLYVKGFNAETTLDELLDFFKEHKAENITMRRLQKPRIFKGSVFVTFESKCDADKFMELKEVKYKNKELLRETKKGYFKRKDTFRQELKLEKEKKRQKRAAEQKDGEDKKDGEEKDETAESEMTEEADPVYIKGCLLKMDGVGAEASRESLKEAMESYGAVAYVDFSRGLVSAVMRFETAIAAGILEKATEEDGVKKLVVGPDTVTISGIEGEEELQYWKDVRKNKSLIRQRYQNQDRHKDRNSHNKYGNKKGRFHHKNRRGSKRPNAESAKDGNDKSPEPPTKKVKSEEPVLKVEEAC